jgi:UDP-hydrolysing UDP-N-acetyl-D-glucosamine 2-epimerase
MRKILFQYVDRADYCPLEPVINAVADTDGFSVLVRQDYKWGLEGHPDLLVLLGDKHQLLDLAHAALIRNVPIAHIHGGETTMGSWDDQVRDAVTKLSNIHFVATNMARTKLLSIGEDFDRIHLVGAPGLDRFKGFTQLDKQRKFVVTYHPETRGESDIQPIKDALSCFPDYEIVWTVPNTEPGNERTEDMVNLTYDDYILHVRTAKVVIGNSSSGIIEAPTLYTPTVNVGLRQQGREMADSVFSCLNETDSILDAIHHALDFDGSFSNPYGGPGASEKIARILAQTDFRKLPKW